MKPSKDVRVFAGKTLYANTISSADATNLIINSPGGTISTNATNITASGASTLTGNGALNLQASTGNNSVNISASGSGVINMLNQLLVNSIIPYNSADLTLAASGIDGNINLTATGSGSIKCNSLVIGSTITATTLTSPSATNLTINSPGGSILTNATRLAPATSLTIAPATLLTFNPGSPAQFNCSVGIANDLGVSGSLNSSGITNTATNGGLALTPNGTGQVQIASGKTLATDIIKVMELLL